MSQSQVEMRAASQVQTQNPCIIYMICLHTYICAYIHRYVFSCRYDTYALNKLRKALNYKFTNAQKNIHVDLYVTTQTYIYTTNLFCTPTKVKAVTSQRCGFVGWQSARCVIWPNEPSRVNATRQMHTEHSSTPKKNRAGCKKSNK